VWENEEVMKGDPIASLELARKFQSTTPLSKIRNISFIIECKIEVNFLKYTYLVSFDGILFFFSLKSSNALREETGFHGN